MRIYIPSKARPAKQKTWGYLPPRVRTKVDVVVDESEFDDYVAAGVNVLAAPDGHRIHERRQWIVEHHLEQYPDDPRLLMLDDDLRFDRRFTENPFRFEVVKGEQLMPMLVQANEALQRYAHMGILHREGSSPHSQPPFEIHNGRVLRAIGFNVEVMRKEGIRFDRVPLMEDMDVTLSLLEAGYANCVITSFLQGQAQTQSPGGCSTYRTPELQAESALKLAEMHPAFVKVVERETKAGWFGGGSRVDVRVQWKQAYEAGVKARDVKTGIRGAGSQAKKVQDAEEE